MATADGMEGTSAPQPLVTTGSKSTTQDWGAAVVSGVTKQLQDPMLWAGAVAGFVAGTVVAFAAKDIWRRIKK